MRSTCQMSPTSPCEEVTARFVDFRESLMQSWLSWESSSTRHSTKSGISSGSGFATSELEAATVAFSPFAFFGTLSDDFDLFAADFAAVFAADFAAGFCLTGALASTAGGGPGGGGAGGSIAGSCDTPALASAATLRSMRASCRLTTFFSRPFPISRAVPRDLPASTERPRASRALPSARCACAHTGCSETAFSASFRAAAAWPRNVSLARITRSSLKSFGSFEAAASSGPSSSKASPSLAALALVSSSRRAANFSVATFRSKSLRSKPDTTEATSFSADLNFLTPSTTFVFDDVFTWQLGPKPHLPKQPVGSTSAFPPQSSSMSRIRLAEPAEVHEAFWQIDILGGILRLGGSGSPAPRFGGAPRPSLYVEP
mmetsp:Transcript_97204/g.208492  ORF Transcript_97204/g.208492 Transcript_97204/m.208492 type:complete len:373 (-) Transcript_97204:22-1140(-)